MGARPRMLPRLLLLLLLLAATVCAAAPELRWNLELVSSACFADAGDRFAEFSVPFATDVHSLRLERVSGAGVSCSRSSGGAARQLSPFACRDALSVGVVCESAVGAGDLKHGLLLAANQSTMETAAAAAAVTSVVLPIGRLLRGGLRCAAVYLEDWLDRTDDAAGPGSGVGTCVSVRAALVVRPKILSKSRAAVRDDVGPVAVIPPHGDGLDAAAPAWVTSVFTLRVELTSLENCSLSLAAAAVPTCSPVGGAPVAMAAAARRLEERVVWTNFTEQPAAFAAALLPDAMAAQYDTIVEVERGPQWTISGRRFPLLSSLSALRVGTPNPQTPTVPLRPSASGVRRCFAMTRWHLPHGVLDADSLASACHLHALGAPASFEDVNGSDPTRALLARAHEFSPALIDSASLLFVRARRDGGGWLAISLAASVRGGGEQAPVVVEENLTDADLAGRPAPPLVACEREGPVVWQEDAQVVDPQCPAHLQRELCARSAPYCAWREQGSRCCFINAAMAITGAVGGDDGGGGAAAAAAASAAASSIAAAQDSSHAARCPCRYASDLHSRTAGAPVLSRARAACTSWRSAHTFRAQIALVCNAAAARDFDRADCAGEFTRCGDANSGTAELISAALARRCAETNEGRGGTCSDPGQQCPLIASSPAPPTTPEPRTSSVPHSPAPSVFASVTLLASPTTFSFRDVQNGNATLRLRIVDAVTQWNATEVLVPDALLGRFFFKSIRFGFDDNVVQHPNTTRISSEAELTIQFGPSRNFMPVTFRQTVELAPAPSWLVNPPAGPLARIRIEFIGDLPSPRIRQAVAVVTIVTTALNLLSGSGGWIGVVALQTFLLQVTSQCSEPFTRNYFASGEYFTAPPTLFQPSARDASIANRVLFIIYFATTMGALVVHSIASLIHFKIFAPFGSFSLSAARLFFPLPYLLITSLSVVAISRHAYSGVIDDKTPHVRVVFLFGWLVCCGSFLLIWYNGIRRGRDGYFLRLQPSARPPSVSRSTNTVDDTAYYKALRQRVSEFLCAFAKRFFKVTGVWPLTRAWGVLRGLMNDQASYFTLVYLMFCIASGINAAHRGDDTTFCYATYWNFSALTVMLMLLSLAFLPLRMPFLNCLWVATRILEFSFAATSAQFVVEENPHANAVDSLPLYAFGVLCLHLVFALASATIHIREMYVTRYSGGFSAVSPDSHHGDSVASACVNESRVTIEAPLLDFSSLHPTPHELDGPNAAYSETHECSKLILNPMRTLLSPTNSFLIQGGSGEHAVAAEERRHQQEEAAAAAQERALDEQRFVLQMHPLPAGLDEAEVMLLFAVFDALDVIIIGRTAFVGIKGRRMALSAASCFNGRVLRGEFTTVSLLESL